MRVFSIVVFLLAAVSANSANVAIDFESQAVDGWAMGFGPVIDNGFIIDGIDTMGIALWAGDTGDSKVLDFCTSTGCGPDTNLTISQVNGNSFDLLSLDFAAVSVLEVTDYLITGTFAGGGSVQQNLVLTDFITPTSGTMTSVLFDGSWSNLSSVDISYAPSFNLSLAAIDNIVVSTVPVPAAVWLFGSALAGLGWLRRKQTV